MITVIPNPPSFRLPLITALNISNPHYAVAPLQISQSRLKSIRRRRRFHAQAFYPVLPLLPFPIDQVLIPSEVKTLHLYEARYIALLEESLSQKNKLFVHFVLEQAVSFDGTLTETSFAARYGCLVIIEKIKRREVGALILIRGVGRVQVLEFRQVQPYLTGEVAPLQDNVLRSMADVTTRVLELKEALRKLNNMEIKLKAPEEALLQTRTANSLFWAEKKLILDWDADFIPSVAERISFAAFQQVSGAGESEQVKLHREKLIAMDLRDTVERLNRAIQLAKKNIGIVADLWTCINTFTRRKYSVVLKICTVICDLNNVFTCIAD